MARAVEVLAQLSAGPATARGTDTLWPVLSLKTGTKAQVSAEIVRQLNAFRDYFDVLFGSPGQPAIPRDPDDAPWRLTTRQFRRTIAWHIANRPFGTVAGMIQYKHASVAAFEGYAGSSCSGFRAEAQRRLGQLDDILDYFDARQGGASLSGRRRPGRPHAGRRRRGAGRLAGHRRRSSPPADPRSLHPGVLADCFFDPATALCLLGRASEASEPAIPLCQPTRCPNACITARHRPAWSQAADHARELLAEKRLSPTQRTVLTGELARFKAVLEGIDETAPSADAPAARA